MPAASLDHVVKLLEAAVVGLFGTPDKVALTFAYPQAWSIVAGLRNSPLLTTARNQLFLLLRDVSAYPRALLSSKSM